MKKKAKLKLKKIMNKKNINTVTFNLIEVIIIILITSLVIGVTTCIIVYKNVEEKDKKDIGTVNANLLELESAYNNIVNGYVEKVDENGLLNAAIEGMYNYIGDPYTSYLDSEETSDLQDRLNGKYYGLGVEITKADNGIEIVNIFEGGPAQNADLQSGDILVKIDETDITEKTAADVSSMIKNSSKEKITIEYIRNDKRNSVEVELSTVIIPSIESKNYDGIGYIGISTFSDTTYSQFKDALEQLEQENINSLVIDVRNNGGGYLNSAVDIAQLFIEKGKAIYGLKSQLETKFYNDSTRESREYNVAVLINSSSASASEILASALKESYGAILVGEKSYGKGTVQETSSLSTGSMVKYTTAYWLTPEGNEINKVGIKPDITVSASTTGEPLQVDLQLEKAINILK